MNIGQVAQQAGVSAKMIRHYEATGLIPPALRTEAGYRVYGERDVHILRFIRQSRLLGFSIEQIRELLDLWQNRKRSSSEVKALASRHLQALEQRISELQSVRDTLLALVQQCHGDDRPDCPILEGIESAS